MKVLLSQDVDSLGKMGDIVNVKDGFARNYLIPQKKAIQATEQNILSIQAAAEKRKEAELKKRADLNALAERLNKLTIKFTLKAGEDDKLFGSVTSQMIVDAVNSKGYQLEKKEIELTEPIKNVGNHFVNVKLGQEEESRIKIKVQADK
tara:strand:- start:2518 stop:2964 length:447 start_codon:yes stop_codon:yes gene_type:complete